MDITKIFSDVLKHCQRTVPSGPWRRFLEDSDTWQLGSDKRAVLRDLEQSHSQQCLLQSGLVVRAARGELEFNPVLVETGSVLVPLRSAPNARPFDLLSDQGLASGNLHASASLADYRTNEALSSLNALFIAFSIQDFVALRSAGLPCAMATGLDRHTPQSLQQFRTGLSWPKQTTFIPSGDHADADASGLACVSAGGHQHGGLHAQDSKASAPNSLVLVGWHLSRLGDSRPADLDAVATDLISMGKAFGLELELILWRPSPAEIRSIAECLAKGHREDVVKAIVRSVDKSAQPLIPSQDAPPRSLLDAASQLRKSLVKSDVLPVDRQRRLRQHQRALEETLVKPLFESAAAEPDLEERSRLSALAAASQYVYTNAVLVQAKLERAIIRDGVDGIDLRDLRDVIKGFDIVHKLAKGGK